MDAKFWAKVDKSRACWIWLGAKQSAGYGHLRRNGDVLAHRYSYFLASGEWPKALLCHKCDNKLCVNPDHFFVGDHQANSDDKIAKGRDKRRSPPSGELNPKARLTLSQVLEMRNLRASGRSIREIAGKVGCAWSTAQHVVSGYTWGNGSAKSTALARDTQRPRTSSSSDLAKP